MVPWKKSNCAIFNLCLCTLYDEIVESAYVKGISISGFQGCTVTLILCICRAQVQKFMLYQQAECLALVSALHRENPAGQTSLG